MPTNTLAHDDWTRECGYKERRIAVLLVISDI